MKTLDHEEFMHVYSEHYQRIFGQVYRSVRNLQDAEDITQEAFLRFAKFLPTSTTRAPGIYYCWLTQTARHLCVDTFRSRGRTKETFSLDDSTAEEKMEFLLEKAEYISYCEKEITTLKLQAIYDGIRLLRGIERNVAIFRYILEMPVTQIVTRMGISDSQYYKARNRVIKRIRSYISHYSPELQN